MALAVVLTSICKSIYEQLVCQLGHLSNILQFYRQFLGFINFAEMKYQHLKYVLFIGARIRIIFLKSFESVAWNWPLFKTKIPVYKYLKGLAH